MLKKTRLYRSGITIISLLALIVLPTGLYASESKTVLLKGPDIEITTDDFQQYFELKIPEQYRAELLMDSNKIHELLEQLYKQKVLEKQAIDLKLDQSPQVKQQIALAKRSVLVSARLEHVVNEASDVNWELKARENYLANRNKFQSPETVKVSHILISQEKHSKDEMQQIAQKVFELVVADEDSFEDLALKYSEDPSAKKNGGSLGAIQVGQMVKPFEVAAFSLQKIGDISSLIETKFGLHIIKLDEKMPARQLAFDEVKGGLIEKQKSQYRLKLRNSFLYKVRDSISYVNTDAIEGLKRKFEVTAE